MKILQSISRQFFAYFVLDLSSLFDLLFRYSSFSISLGHFFINFKRFSEKCLYLSPLHLFLPSLYFVLSLSILYIVIWIILGHLLMYHARVPLLTISADTFTLSGCDCLSFWHLKGWGIQLFKFLLYIFYLHLLEPFLPLIQPLLY